MSIGQTLREAREAAGLTIEQVSESTRIRGTLIRGIEQDDFSLCGGDVYARGHIRSIAKVVGVDPAPLLAEYDGSRGASATADSPAANVAHDLYDSQSARAAAAADRARGPHWSAAIGVVLVIVCVYAGVRLLTGHPSADSLAQGSTSSAAATGAGGQGSAGPPSAAPASSVPANGPSATAPVPAPSSPSSMIAQRPGAVTVAIDAARGTSWVQATDATGQVLYSGLLRKGGTQELSADRSIKLVMGNAGSLDLVVNGTPIGAPGKVGDVVRVTFGPQDPAAG